MSSSEFLRLFDSARLVSFDDKALVDSYLAKFPPIISEHTFSNIYCWRHCYPRKVFEYQGHLMMGYYDHENSQYLFLQPVGNNPGAVIMSLHREIPITWHRVHFDLAQSLELTFDEQAGAENDFVYDQGSMSSLEGPALSTIRRKVKKLKVPYFVRPFSVELLDDCCTIVNEWLSTKQSQGILSPAHNEDAQAALLMLTNACRLNIFGIVSYVSCQPKAFVLGEKLSDNVGVIHFHKGDFSIEGLGAKSLQDMANAMTSFSRINFMQAKGDPGLTTWKNAWRPAEMVRKCQISAA